MKMTIGIMLILIGFYLYHTGLVDALNKRVGPAANTNVLAIEKGYDLSIIELPGVTYSYNDDPNTNYPLQIIMVKNDRTPL